MSTTVDNAPALAPLIERLITDQGATRVTADNVADYAAIADGRDRVLFFSGDPVRFPEGVDVAVVLPELQKQFPGRLLIGVVVREDEDTIARRYGVQRWPSLVFLRNGGYVGTIAGMLDWVDYVARVEELLAQDAGRLPGIGIPLVSAQAGTACR